MKKLVIVFLMGIWGIHFGFSQNRYNSWDIFKYSGPGLKQIGLLAPRQSNEIKSSSWSVGCETLDRDYGDFSKYKNYVGELGVKYGRLQSGWAKCEREKGKYNFEWLDSCVYGLSEQTIEPWICLCYGNPLYASDIRLGAKIFTDETTMTAWLKYVEVTVNRYKSVVKKWEVWNEPNGNESKVYANLLSKTAETIKKADPEAEIMGFSLAGIPLEWTKEVLETLKSSDKLDLINYLTYHPYTQNPDDSYEAVEQLKALVHSYRPEIKLFQGENGCPSQLEWTHALAYYPWTEISQAKWLMRRMAGDHIRGIPTSVFTMIDLQYYNMLQSFGLIRSNVQHEIIYKRPSYYGVQHMAGFFDDTVEPTGILEYSSNAYRKLTVAGFKKEETPVALLWYNDQIPGDEMKWDLITLTIKNTNFKDPVYVEIVSGKVFEIESTDWENKGGDVVLRKLPVWDCVIMIAERSKVKMELEE
jgi:hypothetical protein